MASLQVVFSLLDKQIDSVILCRLCNSQVKFTKESVSGHLRLTHGTDLATYEQCYMQDDDWPDQQAETGNR